MKTPKKAQKLLLMLLAAIMISGTSCSQAGTGESAADEISSDGPQTAGTVEETAEETQVNYYDLIEARDLGGMDFRIISRYSDKNHDHTKSTDYGNNEINAEDVNGTPINDTVYNRNRELEERYNFKFVSYQPDSNPMATAKNSILASSDDYEAVVDSLASMSDYSMFRNYNKLESIDLSASCWDQNVNTSLSIGGQHYVAVGDMLILDKKGTWCTLFNKKMAEDQQLGNLYDRVREGTWTLDAFGEMLQTVSNDVDGDGKMTEADCYGFLTEPYNMNIMLFGGETRISGKDESDYPVLSMFNDRSVAVFEKAYTIMSNRNYVLCSSWAQNQWSDLLKAFSEDRGLFYMVGIGTAMGFRYMESDFGILPIPKYEETQEKYYTSLSSYNSACVAIPKSCSAAENAAFLLQAISLASTDTLQVTFYDTVLNGVTARDEESAEMLDILFENRVFDLAFIQNWGSIGDLYSSLFNSQNSDFASGYKKIEKSTNKIISKAIEKYSELE